MSEYSKHQKKLWEIFVNAPGADAVLLYAEIQKILVSRNLIYAPRTRKTLKQAALEDKANG